MDKVSSKVTDLLETTKRDIVKEAGAMWEAFSHFSRIEVGTEPKKLVKVGFEPGLAELERLETLIIDVESYQHQVGDCESILSDAWCRQVG